MLKKLREDVSREHAQGRAQVEELELQIADLTANFRMRDQFSKELSNTQIYCTTGNEAEGRKEVETVLPEVTS